MYTSLIGPGRMLTVMEYLQKECDVQARQIIDDFRRSRDFNRKVNQVSSFMNSKAESKLNPKELDLVLSELTLLNARTELYSRFVRRRVVVCAMSAALHYSNL
jgi:hypothetical protein